MVWAFLANKTVAKNIDPKNGSHIFEEAKYFESDGMKYFLFIYIYIYIYIYITHDYN